MFGVAKKFYGFWFYRELLPLIGYGKPRFIITTPHGNSFSVRACGSRLECLKRNPICISCHKEGVLWILEQDVSTDVKRKNPHFNLYARNKNNPDGLTLMTQDHIYPISLGGNSQQDNLQTMCDKCNVYKGNSVPKEHNFSSKETSIGQSVT